MLEVEVVPCRKQQRSQRQHAAPATLGSGTATTTATKLLQARGQTSKSGRVAGMQGARLRKNGGDWRARMVATSIGIWRWRVSLTSLTESERGCVARWGGCSGLWCATGEARGSGRLIGVVLLLGLRGGSGRCAVASSEHGGPGVRALLMQGRCGEACTVPRGYREWPRVSCCGETAPLKCISPPSASSFHLSLSLKFTKKGSKAKVTEVEHQGVE